MLEERASVRPDDSILVIETALDAEDAKLVESRAKKKGGRETLLRLLLDEAELTFTLEQRRKQFAREQALSQFRTTAFYRGTRYTVSLFDLVLILYRIPLAHSAFMPLRDRLRRQWEETLVDAGASTRPEPAS